MDAGTMRRGTISFQKAVRSCATPIAEEEVVVHMKVVNIELDIIVSHS